MQRPVPSISPAFWTGKRVLITGHTGFKGSWLSIWLKKLGARLYGFSKAPHTHPALFNLAGIEQLFSGHVLGDIADPIAVEQCIRNARPDVVFHLASQALVRASYRKPTETYLSNVMGTVYLLQSIRQAPSVRSLVVVTSDKCYENQGWHWGYRETDSLGGHDPYSTSKACQEMVTASFKKSFFLDGPGVATVRSGNVIGGGDWSEDRLVPDAMRAYAKGETLAVRYPGSVRPWQHVLEPLSGYLALAQKLYNGDQISGSFNFGPKDSDVATVETMLSKISACLPRPLLWTVDSHAQPHESSTLRLDCSRSYEELGWRPHWDLDKSVNISCDWYLGYLMNSSVLEICDAQINEFQTIFNTS